MVLFLRDADRHVDSIEISISHRNFFMNQCFIQIFLILLFVLPAAGTVNSSRIASERIHVFGVNNDFAPYEYINANDEPDGYTIDLIKAIADKEDLNIKFVSHPWHTVRKNLMARKIDGVTAMLYSKERDNQFDFSLPYVIVSYAIFKRKSTPITSINDLKNKEIIVVERVYAHDWLMANKMAKTIIPVEGPREALGLLASGRHDFAVLPRLHGVDLLADLGIDTVETTGPPVLEQKLCFAVNDGHSDLLAELNEGLFALQKTDEYDKIYAKWFSVRKHQKQTQNIIGIAVLLSGIAIFLFLAVLSCNWLLKKKVREKTAALRQKEARLNQIVDGIPIPTFVIDENRNVTHWNNACEALTGKSTGEIVGTNDYADALFGKDTDSTVDLLLNNALNERVHIVNGFKYRQSSIVKGAYKTERYVNTPDEFERWIVGTGALLKNESGNITGAIETWQDLTEHKQLEKQLLQAQKMEAIGTLAGGIAHNFNNILMGIQGRASLMISKDSSHPDYEHLLSIEACVKNAVELTKELLGFSRRGRYEVKLTNLNELIKHEKEIFSRTKREVEVYEKYERELWPVEADRGQIRQVLMNLYVNAWQAMPDGGDLYIETQNVILDEPYAKSFKIAPGKFVKISVTDTGIGMDNANQEKIFEPFFTTKDPGHGSGLGLASVYGIIKNHGGLINVSSEKGKGSTFNIYLPASEKVIVEKVQRRNQNDIHFGEGTVLLVDDEGMITDVGQKMLESLGYRVLIARSGKEALDVYEEQKHEIDLVILDIIMPGMGGGETYDRLKKANENVKVILSSGYSISGQAKEIMDRGCKGFLQKPFKLNDLSIKIKKVLDETIE